MAKMRAVQVPTAKGPFQLVEREIPVPVAGSVRIKVQACGICHSDEYAKEGTRPGITYPRVPGHEIAGLIDAVGRGVLGWEVGQRVGVGWHGGHDGTCDACLRGKFIHCRNVRVTGISYDGGYAEYVVAPAVAVASMPQGLDFAEAAPFLCAGVTTYKGLKQTGARPGEWVVISGVGGLGHVAIQYAKAMGLHVAAVDLGPEKMALARKLGAEITIDAKTQDPAKEIQKQIGGAHGVLVTAVSLIAFKQAVGMLRRGGTCVLNGLPPGEFPVSIFDIVLNGNTIRGSIVGTRLDLEEALAFAAEGKVKATIETLPLECINDVFSRLKKGQVNGRVVLGIREETSSKAAIAS